jgi:hypothetical protein
VIYRKGQPKFASDEIGRRVSGFNVAVSRADGMLDKQARDAIRFLKRHATGLSRLRRHRHYGGMALDFGLYYSASEQTPWPSYRLSPRLIELAGHHRIEIALSFYGPVPKQPS